VLINNCGRVRGNIQTWFDDGSVNNLDITPFIGLLTAASATAVPEPGSLICIALVLMMGRRPT